jgi:hypothetical protein
MSHENVYDNTRTQPRKEIPGVSKQNNVSRKSDSVRFLRIFLWLIILINLALPSEAAPLISFQMTPILG